MNLETKPLIYNIYIYILKKKNQMKLPIQIYISSN